MPTPDPNGLDIEEDDDGRLTITAEIWPHGNRRHRIARMTAVTRRLRWEGWRCRECNKPVPLYKRADARFCSEQCRKLAARRRRAERLSWRASR
jgi:hypothetical protein